MNQFTVDLEELQIKGTGRSCYRNLTDEERAHLALRIGKALKTLGSWSASEITDVLDRLFSVRFIQSYMLWRDFHLVSKRCSPAVSTSLPLVQTFALCDSTETAIPRPVGQGEEMFGRLAQCIGENFETLRSLDRPQITDVLRRIYRVGYIQGYEILPGREFGLGTVTLDRDEDQWPLLADLDESARGEDEYLTRTDVALDGFLDNQPESRPSHRDDSHPIHNGTSGISTDGSTADPVIPPLDHELSCGDGRASPPSLAGRLSPSLQTNHSSPHCSPRSAGAKRRPNAAAEARLKGCKLTKEQAALDKKQFREVLKAHAGLLCANPAEMLKPLLHQWRNNCLQGRHPLGLPAQRIGLEAAVGYIRRLDAGKALDHVATRVAHMLLYLNYRELCQRPEKYCPRARAAKMRKETFVLNCILDLYDDDPKKSSKDQLRRNRITGTLMRKGMWLWKLVASLGAGLLYNRTFTAAQVDSLINYIAYTRPGTVRLCRSLEPVVKSLMSGQPPDPLHILRDDGTGLQDQLSAASAEDDTVVVSPSADNPWAPIDVEQNAASRMQDFFN
ncbi:uncharacterized protein BJX67DRAFT_386692 [Aspergillus lucknowensis]|uniref:Uncharacterized protein n=1 Tax=Aspergillus lucknowensis TaxID=176173 RepID=A0ABR4L457_9EURO